ncbi:MAG: plastocyanin/azurin family copper-binding protein [Thermoanaerobaculia bacterium]
MLTLTRRRQIVLSAVALLAVALVTATAVFAAGPRILKIKATDDMKYSVNHIDAKPGEDLKVLLSGEGAMAKDQMAHNFILLAAGTDPVAFVTAASMARATGYVPANMKDKILAMTPNLVGAGETTEVTFKAPTKPGTYVYVCTFPGHYFGGMKGELVVK